MFGGGATWRFSSLKSDNFDCWNNRRSVNVVRLRRWFFRFDKIHHLSPNDLQANLRKVDDSNGELTFAASQLNVLWNHGKVFELNSHQRIAVNSAGSMLIVVHAHFQSQQRDFLLSTLDKYIFELVNLSTFHFFEHASRIDAQIEFSHCFKFDSVWVEDSQCWKQVFKISRKAFHIVNVRTPYDATDDI